MTWFLLLVTVNVSFCFNINKEKVATFARDMRAQEYNVADYGIMMGLGKRYSPPSTKGKGIVMGLGKRDLLSLSGRRDVEDEEVLSDLPSDMMMGKRAMWPLYFDRDETNNMMADGRNNRRFLYKPIFGKRAGGSKEEQMSRIFAGRIASDKSLPKLSPSLYHLFFHV